MKDSNTLPTSGLNALNVIFTGTVNTRTPYLIPAKIASIDCGAGNELFITRTGPLNTYEIKVDELIEITDTPQIQDQLRRPTLPG